MSKIKKNKKQLRRPVADPSVKPLIFFGRVKLIGKPFASFTDAWKAKKSGEVVAQFVWPTLQFVSKKKVIRKR